MINSNARANFNKRASELVEKLVIQLEEVSQPQNMTGSDAEIYALDWSDKIVEPLEGISRNLNMLTGEYSDIFFTKNKKRIGFEGEIYSDFIKLSKSIYRTSELNKKVTNKFIESELFNWILDVHINSIIKQEFCDFLEDKVNDVCDTWTVAFKVLYLRIPCKIIIGDTWIDYTRKNEIEEHIIRKGEIDSKDIEATRNIFGNTVYVACEIKNCSRDRAIDLAYEKCALSVDILKCFSPTVTIPKIPLQFDIDSRTKKNEKNFTFVFKETFFNDLTVTLTPSAGAAFEFPKEFIIPLHSHIFQTLNNSKTKSNELKDVVRMNVKKYAAALSNENLYERIVLLASIWDSIFVKNENEPVQYTITQYGPKVISNNVNDRKQIKKLIKKMYACRSAYIHRANESEFENEELANFQFFTLQMLSALAHLSFFYSTTADVIELIDEEIEAAFDINNYVKEIPINS